jgi:hypothetical protein
MRPQFPKRGVHDNDPTPQALYDIIVNKLGFTDVCQDPKRFDATASIWPNRSYCNPPFRNKRPFVRMAVQSNRLGNEVLLYLPLDPTTRWFKELYNANALIIIFTKRMKHSKYPHALYLLKDFKAPQFVLVNSEQEIFKYLASRPI